MSMDQDFNQVDVEQAMWNAVSTAEEIVRAIRKRAEEAESSEARYRVAKAEAFLRQKDGTVAEREARAVLATEAELFDRGVKRALLKSVEAAARANREGQQTLRSLNTNLRDQVTG